MKILITGMNKNQTTKDFYLRQQLKVVPSHYSLIRCLESPLIRMRSGNLLGVISVATLSLASQMT